MVTPQSQPMTQAEIDIREAIQRDGRVTFARFMDLALFSPGGYYPSVRAQPGGRLKDFFTSPAAHPLFGWLLAGQLDEIWTLLGKPQPFDVVELGAGDGLLARDVIQGAQQLKLGFLEALRYTLADRTVPKIKLEAGLPQTRRVVTDGMPLSNVGCVVGCVLSNELLDAFPVHRFCMQGGKLLEVYVSLKGDRFTEVLGEPSTDALGERAQFAAPRGLPDGFRGEVCLALDEWVRQVAGMLSRGVVLTVDYGGASEELYAPEHTTGMLRCYYRHTVSGNPYVRVGRQDITTHVDFTVLTRLGAATGLLQLGYTTQRAFLQNLGADSFLQALSSRQLQPHELALNQAAMKELRKPEGLGRFRLLAQGKRVDDFLLTGFDPKGNAWRTVLKKFQVLPVPLLTPEHMTPPLVHIPSPFIESSEHALQGLWPDEDSSHT